ncbi:MAG: hypothetical protein AB7L13_23300 [Acidimicrobiia bacterium]
MPVLTAAQVKVGEEIPVHHRPNQGFEEWNRYAAVNDEFVNIHMHDEGGRAAGMASAFGMGNISTAYVHIMLRTWIGVEEGRIVKVGLSFRSPLLRYKDCTAHGLVKAIRPEGDEVFIDLDVWTQDQDGTKFAIGDATVAIAA